MYRVEPDPYCYPGTTVLINRLGTTDQSILDAFEAEMTSQRAMEALPTGRLSYSLYRSIHRHFFQDVYRWAGRIRTVRISKGSSEFCYPENIDREMRRLFAGLTAQKYFRGLGALKFADNAAHFLAELNAIHPFREGNGRMQLTFLTILAQHAGCPLNLERWTRRRCSPPWSRASEAMRRRWPGSFSNSSDKGGGEWPPAARFDLSSERAAT